MLWRGCVQMLEDIDNDGLLHCLQLELVDRDLAVLVHVVIFEDGLDDLGDAGFGELVFDEIELW